MIARIKQLFCAVFLSCITLSVYGQDQVIMELEEILFNTDSLKQFVEEKCKSIEMSYTEKLEKKHPMADENFNWAPKNENQKFTIFGKEVLLLLIYEKDGKYSSNLMLEAKKVSDFDPFVKHLGYPENTPPENYLEGKFMFLYWETRGFEIFINKVHAGKAHKHHFRAKIYNMSTHRDTVDMRGLGN